MLVSQGAFQLRKKLLNADRGEKAKPPQIHGEKRNIASTDGARGGKQRPVAAKHDHKLAVVGNVFAIQPLFGHVTRSIAVQSDRDVARR